MKWLREVRHKCREVGATLEQRGSGHYLATMPNGRRISVSATPSDRRAGRNLDAAIRRARRPAAEMVPVKPVSATALPPPQAGPEPGILIEQPFALECPPRARLDRSAGWSTISPVRRPCR